MNVDKLYKALYNKGFRNTESYEIIGKIAVMTNGFKKPKYSDTFQVGKRKVEIIFNNDNGGTFSFGDVKESLSSDIKLRIQED